MDMPTEFLNQPTMNLIAQYQTVKVKVGAWGSVMFKALLY